MLVKFICQNVLSFYNEIEFRMFKNPTRSFSNHIFHTKNSNPEILKSSIIYGANASGKSNFVKAIDIGRDFIMNGPINPARLDIPFFKLCANECNNTLFEYTILSNNKYYVYGFEITNSKVLKEWCYKLNNKKPKLLFERETTDSGVLNIKIGDFVKNDNDKIFYNDFCKKATKKTQLYLTTVINNNSKDFDDIIDWFRKLTIIYPESTFGNIFSIIADQKFYKSFIQILHNLDIDIDEFTFHEGSIDDSWVEIPQSIINDIKKNIDEKNSISLFSNEGHFFIFSLVDHKIKATKLISQHLNSNNELINFDLPEESDGTRRLFDLIPMLLNFKMKDSVFIVDEIDRSLHSILSKNIFKLFFKYTDRRPCQLIATTHDTNLMDLDLFRNDEIWYVKKNYARSSELYSLYEFKQRYDKKLVKDYLNGRFGAVPEINIDKG